MKKVLLPLVVAVFMAMVLAGCKTISPVGATSNPVGAKVGESSGFTILMFIQPSAVDTSIMSAAKNGGITSISTVDYEVVNYLGFYQTYTCRVTGK